MRLDDYLSTVFLIKRRTLAKEWISGGKVKLNGRAIKPAHEVKVGDQIEISHPHQPLKYQVLEIPGKSVSHKDAGKYYRQIQMPPVQ